MAAHSELNGSNIYILFSVKQSSTPLVYKCSCKQCLRALTVRGIGAGPWRALHRDLALASVTSQAYVDVFSRSTFNPNEMKNGVVGSCKNITCHI